MLMSLIFSGALERFPNLKIVIGEAGLGWIPYVLQHMDLEWEDQFKDLDLKMKPSEYWHRQCYATYQTDPVGIRLLDILGEDNVMWGSDYPHPDGIWPDFAGVPRPRAFRRERRGAPQDHARQRDEALSAGQLIGWGRATPVARHVMLFWTASVPLAQVHERAGRSRSGRS